MNSSQTTIDASPPAGGDWRELASRDNDGLEVSLLWSKSADRVRLVVADTRLEVDFELDVAGADALAAFLPPLQLPRDSDRDRGVLACGAGGRLTDIRRNPPTS